MVAIDRNEEDYAAALHVLNDVEKVNYKGSGVPESKVLWWRASIYSDMEDSHTAVTIMEMQSSRTLRHQSSIIRERRSFSARVSLRNLELLLSIT